MSGGSFFFFSVSKLLLKASSVKDIMGKCMTLAVRLWSSHTFYFLKLLYQEWSGLQNVNWKENVYLMEQCISLCGKEALPVKGRVGLRAGDGKEPTAESSSPAMWFGARQTLMILWKTLHFGHISAHVYKVCACAWAHANTNLAGESVVQTPAKIFIQNCFMAHGSVCMCV